MKPGDILAYKINRNTTNPFSKAISWLSRITVGNWLVNGEDSYNHVAILSSIQGLQYEVTWPRGGLNPIKWEKYDVFSVEYQGITEEQQEIILQFCNLNAAKYKYDWLSLITFGLLRLPGRTSICSRLVADAYLAAGIDLRKPNEYLISPNEIVYHPNMVKRIVYKDS